ncbi:phytanoyl-CoA dioxygenase family protein [Bradyrhizobium sp. U87765 SZCCT0131]|nr:phytanoyl-CoA dioxygenase family protein [Bradyrhizobium sp. U87765 SZCCT0131]MBR1262753.1 phytanoyl-CoA dioxygenase family protein [Bradyrhizobium sp. U87765 SZCCT0134]MBR1308775.1 phytanoyl-CoA dioxygenase family protein [Bradyrhizobium sp. U87765 SZCCT0110]MBR1318535.1 phytanoyl-CoA dioxygenase family protein [Bradyrhizobium sp. U87765 SZCCT0109]MBR1352239.1 phytanoyl-CoA dioxygenase family protein [Bradyrhizobium sp. U87765 SZCCT0048]
MLCDSSVQPASLTFADDGAQLFDAALTTGELRQLQAVLSHLPADHAGLRLRGVDGLAPFLAATGPIGRCAASALGHGGHPVRAILFDKTPATNWALGWHQDRTIAVQQRVAVEGFVTWSVKGGMTHVEPPFAVLAGMVTLRVHLDAVPASNAPLLIAPGSHTLGRIAEDDIRDVVGRCGTVACLAAPGDIWLYATPILHASEAAVAPTHRRVLQIDFAVGGLPGGLEWLGV